MSAHTAPCAIYYQRIFTDENLYDADERQELESFAKYMSAYSKLEDGDDDLVLEVRDDERGWKGYKTWCYYFVSHTNKVIFWLEKYDASQMIAEVKGIKPADEKSCLSKS